MHDTFLNMHYRFLKKLFIDLIKRTQTHHQSAFAAQIAFFFFLSLFPFITVFVTVVGGFFSIESLTQTMMSWKSVPLVIKELILSFLSTAQTQHIPILSLSFITILWSTSRAYYALAHALSTAQGSEKPPNYWLSRVKGLAFSLFIALGLYAVLLLPVLSSPLISAFVKWVHWPAVLSPIILLIKYSFYTLVIGLFLLMCYSLIPPLKLNHRELLPGVAFTIVIWWIEAAVFNHFVLKFTQFSLIYGTLATVVILMLWLYTLAGTLIMGAHFNALLAIERGRKNENLVEPIRKEES